MKSPVAENEVWLHQSQVQSKAAGWGFLFLVPREAFVVCGLPTDSLFLLSFYGVQISGAPRGSGDTFPAAQRLGLAGARLGVEVLETRAEFEDGEGTPKGPHLSVSRSGPLHNSCGTLPPGAPFQDHGTVTATMPGTVTLYGHLGIKALSVQALPGACPSQSFD